MVKNKNKNKKNPKQTKTNLLSNINLNEFTGFLFVDFAMAFDVTDHPLLLRKLELR